MSEDQEGQIKISEINELQSPQQNTNRLSQNSLKRSGSQTKQISFKNSMRSSKQQKNEPHLHTQKSKGIGSMRGYSSGQLKYMSQRTFLEKQKQEQMETEKLEGQLEKLAQSRAFDVPIFLSNESKVDVDYEQVNQSLGIIDLSKTGFLKKIDKLPKYDPKIHKKISSQLVKQRIHQVNPQYNINEVNNMFPFKGEMTSVDLYEFLKDNQINEQEFPEGDPMTLAMKLFTDQEDNLSFEKVSQALSDFGMGSLDKKDVQILKEFMDLDGNGKISMDDLKKIFNPDSIQFIKEKQAIYEKENPQVEKKGFGALFPF